MPTGLVILRVSQDGEHLVNVSKQAAIVSPFAPALPDEGEETLSVLACTKKYSSTTTPNPSNPTWHKELRYGLP